MRILDKYLGSTAFLRSPDEPTGGAPSDSSPSETAGSTSPSSGAPSSSSPSPASASPAPTPSAAAPSEPASAASADSGIDFDLFFNDSGDAPTSPKPAGPAPSPALATPPKEPPAAVPAAAEPPKAATPEPPKPAPGPQPTPSGADGASAKPPLNPMDPASLAAHLQENEAAMIDHLANGMLALSKEDMEELETDVSKAVPRLLARTFVKMQSNMLQQMARLVPNMVQTTTEAVRRNAESRSKFFDRWKGSGLNAAEHGELVDRYAQTYRSLNPTATFEKMVEDLGPILLMATGAKPTAPSTERAAPPKPQPFVPATPGATAVLTTPVEEDSAVSILDPSREF